MFKKILLTLAVCSTVLFTVWAQASSGGISVGGTRVIYNQGDKQTSISVRNNSLNNKFLIQSWVTDSSGNKTKDFIVTPPLYVSESNTENAIRIIRTNEAQYKDREKIYYLVVKSIPYIEKSRTKDNNTLLIAVANKIKLFYRPSDLSDSPDDALDQLVFKRTNKSLLINNPTPFYLTLVNITCDGQIMRSIMIPPREINTQGNNCASNKITYSIINDYGGITKPITKEILQN